MTRSLIVVAVAAALSLAVTGVADAQKKPTASATQKLYRWVDAQGKVQISDTLPPEAISNARTEINARTGHTANTVGRELTPAERAEAEAIAERERLATMTEEQRRREEDSMLSSYLTEDDLKRAYGERTSLLKQTLESTDISLMSLRASLAAQLAEASESELAGRKVDDKRLGTIRELHNELLKQRHFQGLRHSELLALDSEFERMLVRYRERRASESGAVPTPAPTPPPQP